MIKWVFFDLDGVLLNSRKWHTNALKEALIIEGIKLQESEHERLDGLPTKTKLEIISKNYELSLEQIQRIKKTKQLVTLELLEKHVLRDEKLRDLLEELKGQGLKLAVCTNAVRETLDYCLNQLGISDLFEFTLSNEDVASPKPSPEIYLLGHEKAKVSKKEILIVEDSVHGMNAALKSGCNVVKVKDANDLTLDKFELYLEGIAG